MRPLELHSERYQATGNVSGVGVLNQLGRPAMDRLTLLVRESAQNSWDALLGVGPVRYSLDGWSLSSAQDQFLRTKVLPELPPYVRLPDVEQPLRLLVVSDRGTTGLTGPTRADVAVEDDEPTHFVDFLRNVGQPPENELGGGTYGFGKASLYLASGVGTILVYTRCRVGGQLTSRLIAAALTEEHKSRGVRYTGRHWWGRICDGVAEPVTGSEADEAAAGVGMTPFGDGESGTSIAVVQPDFGEASPEDALRGMVRALLSYYWAKTADGPAGSGSMSFSASWDRQAIEVPEPRATHPLGLYVRALENALAVIRGEQPTFRGGRVERVTYGAQKVPLGVVSITQGMAPFQPAPSSGDPEPTTPFVRQSHHVALLRSPHLVVKYLEGPPLPDERLEYAGVFVAYDSVDRAFANSEPPTHDDWIPGILKNRQHQSYVRVALQKLKELVTEFAAPPELPAGGATSLPLGALAHRLSGLIPGSTGNGAGAAPDGAPGQPRAGSARSAVRVHALGHRHVLAAGEPALEVPFSMQFSGRPTNVVISAEARVAVLDGAYESDPPAGASVPRVLHWISPQDEKVEASELMLGSNFDDQWRVVVSLPSDAAVSVILSVRPA